MHPLRNDIYEPWCCGEMLKVYPRAIFLHVFRSYNLAYGFPVFFSAHFFRWNNFNEIAKMQENVKRVIFWCIHKKFASNINFLWSLKNEVRKNCAEHHYDRVILYSFHHDLVYCIGKSRRPSVYSPGVVAVSLTKPIIDVPIIVVCVGTCAHRYKYISNGRAWYKSHKSHRIEFRIHPRRNNLFITTASLGETMHTLTRTTHHSP